MSRYYQPEPISEGQLACTPPILGQWCVVKALAEKVHDPESDMCTRWMRRRIDEQRMMFIGVRQVREGGMKEIEEYDYEDGFKVAYAGSRMAFQAKRFLTVWLFVPDAYKKPVHVLPADASEIPF